MKYAGVEVVDSQPAPVRHPRWGRERPTVLKGAQLLLLADETALVVCGEEGCNYNGITGSDPYATPVDGVKPIMDQADSVLAHKSGKHWLKAPRGSMYSDQKIMVAIKIYLKWKATHLRNWSQFAVNELDALGFTPYRSDRWTTGALSALVNTQMKKPQFKNIKAAPLSEADQEVLSKMVLEAAGREAALSGSKSTLAATARITPAKKREPIDSNKIIADVRPNKEEADVPAASAPVPASTPKISFASLSAETKTVNAARNVSFPDESYVKVASQPGSLVSLPPVEFIDNGFKYIADLPDGTPLFTYHGVLMAGKEVKGIQF